MRVLTARLGQLILAGSVATTSLVLGAATVAAANPGPIRTPFTVLRDPGPMQCPDGLEVALAADPAVGGLPGIALFKNPGPQGCAQGVTVFKNPGPPGAPGTVAELPLNADDCAVGTASLQATADALGLVVAPPDPAAGPGPTGCAAGDTLTAALADVLRNPGPRRVPGRGRGRQKPGAAGTPEPGPARAQEPRAGRLPVGHRHGPAAGRPGRRPGSSRPQGSGTDPADIRDRARWDQRLRPDQPGADPVSRSSPGLRSGLAITPSRARVSGPTEAFCCPLG